MWKTRFRTVWRWAGCKYLWCCVMMAVVCATLALDHYWRTALAMCGILLVCLSALHEEVYDEQA